MKRQLLAVTALLALFVLAVAPSARAQSCGYGGGDCWGGGYGYMYNILRYEVPHFAAFPPVYYSAPVPRTYGYSPFAYGPNVMTPEIVAEVEPLTINNPYAPATTPASAPVKANSDNSASTSRAVEPLVVINPYVTLHGTVAQSDQ